MRVDTSNAVSMFVLRQPTQVNCGSEPIRGVVLPCHSHRSLTTARDKTMQTRAQIDRRKHTYVDLTFYCRPALGLGAERPMPPDCQNKLLSARQLRVLSTDLTRGVIKEIVTLISTKSRGLCGVVFSRCIQDFGFWEPREPSFVNAIPFTNKPSARSDPPHKIMRMSCATVSMHSSICQLHSWKRCTKGKFSLLLQICETCNTMRT